MARRAAGGRTHCWLGIRLSYATGPEQELIRMMCECLPVDTDVVASPQWWRLYGASVCNTGAPRWGTGAKWPLGVRTARFVEVVNGSVLRGFATRPAERRHPVHDNVRDFDLDLSPANAVSAD